MSVAPAAVTGRHVDEIDRAIQGGVASHLCAGAGAVASVVGRIFHRQIYGQTWPGAPVERLRHAAAFDLGGLSMPLGAGLAALWLVGQGRLDLGATVASVLKDMAAPPFDRITVAMLLDHTSGLQASAPLYAGLLADDARRHPTEQLAGTPAAAADLRRRLAGLPPAAAPGVQVRESELGFMVLGWVLEQVVGKPLDVFLRDAIYRPLGVDAGLFFRRRGAHRLPTAPRVQLAASAAPGAAPRAPGQPLVAPDGRAVPLRGEVSCPNAWALGGVAGHAGLFGSASAVWQVAQVLLQSYLGDGAFFHTATVARFWTRSRRVTSTRTLGWDTPTVLGSSAGKRLARTAVGHLGRTGTALYIDTTSQVIGVLLANSLAPLPDGEDPVLTKWRARYFDLVAAHAALGPPALDAAEAMARLGQTP